MIALETGRRLREATEPVLSIRGLRTTFRSRGLEVDAVRGVDLDLHPGEISVLLGESGSGKSVTARSILRLYGSSTTISGSAILDGRDLLGLGRDELLQARGAAISLVPQDPTSSLDPLRRVGPQIVEVLRLHGVVPERRAARARAEELLGLVGIPDPARVAHSFPHELSGGMCQRVAIAIAISCRPKVLIADEPTTALDVTVQAQILELFQRLIRELDAALLLVTHDVGVAADVADRISVMYAGRIVEHGAANTVLRDPVHPYTRLLLESIPTPETARGALRPIVGQPPVSGAIPSGCAFRTRCPSVRDACSGLDPALSRVRWREVACPVASPAADVAAVA